MCAVKRIKEGMKNRKEMNSFGSTGACPYYRKKILSAFELVKALTMTMKGFTLIMASEGGNFVVVLVFDGKILNLPF